MTQAASITAAARHFGVSDRAVRGWIQAGCPCISLGTSGRGRGALLNLQDVARWRAAKYGARAPELANVMERIEAALVDVLRRDGGNGRPIAAELGITHEQAARFLTAVHRRISHALENCD